MNLQSIKSAGIGFVLALVALILTVVLIVIGKMEFLPLGGVLLLIELAILL